MLASCSFCRKDYVATKKVSSGQAICKKCSDRNKKTVSPLGLHPALEHRWANNATPTIANDPIEHKRKISINNINNIPKIPGFELSYQIGKGAMGSVYKARQVKTGKSVAIKVLSKDLSKRLDLIARFEREAFALKSLNHINVVSIIDAGNIGELHYFVMEFIDGITLRARINRGSFSANEAMFITSQILSGLSAAHAHGIVHRDLKPENVLLSYDSNNFSQTPSRVVLVDFGLVGIGGMLFDPHPNLTRSRVTMGTLNYMAPEQHIDAKRVDHRSDLYSAGVMLFEMITSELPLGRYLLPHERGMGTPIELDGVIAKALARNAQNRFNKAKDFIDELNKILEAKDKTQNEQHLTINSAIKRITEVIKPLIDKSHYALLLILAASLFGFGIKMSAKHSINEKTVKESNLPTNN